jgi:hypothetical protein
VFFAVARFPGSSVSRILKFPATLSETHLPSRI